ncbi:MAG: hypothetical protein ACOC95_06390 [Planctomycetota bacterium]
MASEVEYQKLSREIANHQDYSIRVMIYTLMVVGGIVGISGKLSEPALVSTAIILMSSLFYLIGAARKIFLIGAYVFVVYEKEKSTSWHSVKDSVCKGMCVWYETQTLALIYAVISGGIGWLFFDFHPVLVGATTAVLLGLAATLFLVPTRRNSYVERVKAAVDGMRRLQENGEQAQEMSPEDD